jgi:hypothetical protein
MGAVRITAATALALLVAALSGCGHSDPAEGLISNIDKARNARTLSSLQQALISVSLAQSESGSSSPAALAAALQQRDPSNRYTTGPPTDAGVVQVLGGGARPVMLVGINSPPSSPRPPYYLALWENGGATLYYVGQQPPQYTVQPPVGPGWSNTPSQA